MPLDTSFGTVILLKNALFVVFIVAAFSNFTYGIISTVCLLFVLRYYRLKPLKFDTVCERLGFPQGEDNSLSLSPILHRGGNVHFPENTLEGIKKVRVFFLSSFFLSFFLSFFAFFFFLTFVNFCKIHKHTSQ